MDKRSLYEHDNTACSRNKGLWLRTHHSPPADGFALILQFVYYQWLQQVTESTIWGKQRLISVGFIVNEGSVELGTIVRQFANHMASMTNNKEALAKNSYRTTASATNSVA